VLVKWLPALLLLLIGVGRGACGGGVRETEAPSFHVDPWRIKRALVGPGALFGALVLDESPCDPSLFFVGISIVAELSGGILGRYVFQLEKSGCSFAPTVSGGLLPLRGGLLASVSRLSVVVVSGPQLSDDAMAIFLGLFIQWVKNMLVLLICCSWCHLKPLKILRQEGGQLQRDCSGRRQ
jgi:hypothetical protein